MDSPGLQDGSSRILDLSQSAVGGISGHRVIGSNCRTVDDPLSGPRHVCHTRRLDEPSSSESRLSAVRQNLMPNNLADTRIVTIEIVGMGPDAEQDIVDLYVAIQRRNRGVPGLLRGRTPQGPAHIIT